MTIQSEWGNVGNTNELGRIIVQPWGQSSVAPAGR